MFKSESDRECENKYNIDNIRPYLIRLHPYYRGWAAAKEPLGSGMVDKRRRARSGDARGAAPWEEEVTWRG